VYVDDGSDRQWINVAEVVVDQDVAEAADLPPGNIGARGLPPVRQLLRGFCQRLEIAQGSIVKDVVLCDVATGLDSANLDDRVQHVECIGLPRFGHNDTASSITRSLM